MTRHYVTMHDGQEIDLINPESDRLDIHSIIVHLDRIPRYTGATRRVYNVLEHSTRGALILPPKYRKAFLLHDAHEAIIGDIKSPVSGLPGWSDLVKPLKHRCDLAIQRAFAVDITSPDVVAQIARVDRVMLQREWIDLMPTPWTGPDYMGADLDVPVMRIDPDFTPSTDTLIKWFFQIWMTSP